MTRTQDIVGIQISDLMITCGFTENYAKNLHQFISDMFIYDDFDIEINGIVVKITLHSYCDITLIFKKKAIKNKTEVQIISVLYDTPYIEQYTNYVSFCEMLTRLRSKII